jgi:hypothetical protein
VLTLGCNDNLGNVSLLPFQLTVSPGAPISGQPFVADLTGTGSLSEELLDAVQWTIPGGVARVNLIDAQAAVHVRAGATGDDVTLVPQAIPYRCAIDPASACDPEQDLPSVPGRRGNSDCVPTGSGNPCGRFVDIPISDDCATGGECATLDAGTGTKLNQCATNGFCVTGTLTFALISQLGQYVAEAAGDVLFGWADQGTGAVVRPDGTWELPPAVFDDALGPNGIRVNIGGLSVAFECAMGVDGDGPYGVGVAGQSSPTPDALLVAFPIQAP